MQQVLTTGSLPFTRLVTRCETDKFRAIGLMVSLRASFEYCSSRLGSASPQLGEDPAEHFARSEREYSSGGDEVGADVVRGFVRGIDSQHAQERASIEKWRQLVTTDLSDDSLWAWWLPESECDLTPLGSGETAR